MRLVQGAILISGYFQMDDIFSQGQGSTGPSPGLTQVQTDINSERDQAIQDIQDYRDQASQEIDQAKNTLISDIPESTKCNS